MPTLTEVANQMRAQFEENKLSETKEEALSRVLLDYERVADFTEEHKLIVYLTATSLAVENGFRFSNVERELQKLLQT